MVMDGFGGYVISSIRQRNPAIRDQSEMGVELDVDPDDGIVKLTQYVRLGDVVFENRRKNQRIAREVFQDGRCGSMRRVLVRGVRKTRLQRFDPAFQPRVSCLVSSAHRALASSGRPSELDDVEATRGFRAETGVFPNDDFVFAIIKEV